MKKTSLIKFTAISLSLAFLAGCSSMGGDSGFETGNDAISNNEKPTTVDTKKERKGTLATGIGERTNRFGVEIDENGVPQERIIYFPYDSEKIDKKYSDMIHSHAEYLKSHNNKKLKLKGHTDERGTREYNMALSGARAESVKRYMRVMGVPDKQILTIGYGEEAPAVKGDSNKSYEKNRRVEFDYFGW